LAGTNLIYGLGMLEMGMTFSYSQLVMDCEIAKMIKFVVNGITVNDETLAVDAIRETGPFQNFLIHPLTMKYMRSQSQPELMDRNHREKWENEGSLDLNAKAARKAKHILETHQPEPLPDGVLTDIRKIVAETEAELGVNKK
jgi:trimethylamine--corrinoid protein Co-methyltransferase